MIGDSIRAARMRTIILTTSLIVLLGIYSPGFISEYVVDVRDYIDIQEIHIEPTPEGERIYMTVLRDLGPDPWDGWYQVTIRNSRRFCTTGWIDGPYDPDAELPNPITLDWWAFGGKCTALVGDYRDPNNPKPPTIPAGVYAVQTCHRVDDPTILGWSFGLPPAERCTPETVLEIIDPTADRYKGG